MLTNGQPVSDKPKPSWSRRIWRLLKRLGLAAFFLIVIFLIFGFFYERSALRGIAEDFPPPGKRVDIGGRAIHLNVQGEGVPTVIFEAGLGASSISWDLVAPKVARSARVITYDRAGLGWSDPGPRSDAGSIATDLRAALRADGIEGPYVLVGQSIGGMYVRLFSYRNPSDVVGIVLVDSSHEDQFDRFPEAMTRRMRRMQYILPIAVQSARCGIPRMFVELPGNKLHDYPMPEESKLASRRFLPSHSTLRTVQRELRALPEIGEQVSAEQIPWHDLPLVVLTAGNILPKLPPEVSPEEVRELWMELQQELASRSTNAIHRIAHGSGHNIHIEQPEIVIDEILRLVEHIRQKN